MSISNEKCFICFPFKTNALYVKGTDKNLSVWLINTYEPNLSILCFLMMIENVSEKFFC